ncbi:hypothetical protein Nepgr_000177 [Nepenthes gracilis]|uniref:Uncharacterized protein n=1 Tax=Nepenthes gracilis TaxID=150966 RepID=A0AAD3RWL7_NEPGR|nr:hypothetical protein Nepgr_000177 [Nepenthes gracilis]
MATSRMRLRSDAYDQFADNRCGIACHRFCPQTNKVFMLRPISINLFHGSFVAGSSMFGRLLFYLSDEIPCLPAPWWGYYHFRLFVMGLLHGFRNTLLTLTTTTRQSTQTIQSPLKFCDCI